MTDHEEPFKPYVQKTGITCESCTRVAILRLPDIIKVYRRTEDHLNMYCADPIKCKDCSDECNIISCLDHTYNIMTDIMTCCSLTDISDIGSKVHPTLTSLSWIIHTV